MYIDHIRHWITSSIFSTSCSYVACRICTCSAASAVLKVLEVSAVLAVTLCKIIASDQQYHMGEVIVEKGKGKNVFSCVFVCARAVQSQLFSSADLFSIVIMLYIMNSMRKYKVFEYLTIRSHLRERVAPFNWLFGATRWLHLRSYMEPPVAPNSFLNGATLSLGWLQIANP